MTTFADQLKQAAPKLLSKPRLVPVLGITGRLVGTDKEQSARIARDEVLKWLGSPYRVGRLPDSAWKHEDFDISDPRPLVKGVGQLLENGYLWAIRYDHTDSRVPGRMWSTEIIIAQRSNAVDFSLRSSISTNEFEPEFETTIPGIVKQITEHPGLVSDGSRITDEVTDVEDETDLDILVECLEDGKRTRPIIVISLDADCEDFSQSIIDAGLLGKKTLGLAHIARITGPMCYRLSDRLGKKLSVYNGAVRVYRTGFNTSSSNPYDHPLYLKEAIQSWSDHHSGADFVQFLVKASAAESMPRRQTSYTQVKQHVLEQRMLNNQSSRTRNTTNEELFDLSEAENKNLKLLIESLQQEIHDLDDYNDELCESVDKKEAEVRKLNADIESLKYNLSALEAKPASRDNQDIRALILNLISDNPSLIQALNFIKDYYPDQICVLDSAYKSARESSDLKHGKKALHLLVKLATDYYKTLLHSAGGDSEARKVFGNNAYAANEGNAALSEAGRNRRTFLYGSEPILMLSHLKIGTADNATNTLRIHFKWIADEKKIVIGHCGKHLDF